MHTSLHHLTSRGRTVVFSVLLSLFAWTTPDLAAYPNYPKYYGDGRGLAITAYYVQRWNGSTWEKADWYLLDNRYRIRARFTNFFYDAIPTYGPAYGNCGIYITNIVVHLKLTGARFTSSQRSDSGDFLMPGWVDDHPDFNDAIAPEESRWFNFGEFTWRAGPVRAATTPIQLYTVCQEVLHMPPGPWTNMVPH